MAYIGRGINSGDAVSDHLTGSGATVYTLTYDTTTDGVVLSLDGVVQRNGTDFTILGTQLTFTSAVASPIAIQIIYTGLTLAIGTPGTGTVGISQLSATGTPTSALALKGDNTWGTAGGPSLGTDAIIRTNAKVIAANITFLGSENGMTAGPVTINSGITVTVTSGSIWTTV
tara:strand:- start:1250 stop:1765 length:516 start_codon:yes stop_codon:yes gene_type:complete